MGKAVIFVRVSTEKQHLESQEAELRRKALYDGFNESDIIYIGKKESGYKLEENEREGLEELNQLIEKGDIDTTYIWELSRVSRKPKILYSVRDKLFENKIQLKCLNPQFTLLTNDRTKYDNTANIIFSLFGALAEQEVIEKKERFARGKKRLAEEGKYNGGAIPFGYKIDKEKNNLIVVNDDEAIIIREIYNMYENGYSQTKIAKEYYARGMKKITISFVHQILTNILLTGQKHKSIGASYERQYPPIISIEQFERCRKIASSNNTALSKARNIYYADRLIRCLSCGTHWTSNGAKVAYRCYDAQNINKKYNGYDGKARCKDQSCISINVLDSLLWHIAIRMEEEFILTDAKTKVDNYMAEKAKIIEKQSKIDNLIDDVKQKKQRLLLAYADGLDEKVYNKKKALLAAEEQSIRAQEIAYKDEIEHLNNLIANVQSSLQLNSVNEIEKHIDYVINLIDEISKIQSDEVRYKIIHRHIKEITVESTTVKYKFAHYKEEKDVKAKHITIYPYIGKPLYYYYISNGGVMLYCDYDNNIKGKAEIKYLHRFTDKGKVEKRKAEKEQRRNLKQQKIEERHSNGLLTFREAAEKSKINYATLWYAAKDGRLKYHINNKVKYIREEDLDYFAKNRRKSSNT